MNTEETTATKDFTKNSAYIDETIIKTPQPQASSTVERKGSDNRNIRRHRPDSINRKIVNECPDQIPIEDVDDSALIKSNISSQSSLGILSMDKMQDIQDVLCTNETKENILKRVSYPVSTADVTDKLKMQRLLAQKALDRADSKSRTNVGGLPSYLLKTPDRNITAQSSAIRNENESTLNLSDFENSLQKTANKKNLSCEKPEELSFQSNEISARSSSFGSRNYVDFHNSDFASKCQAMFDIVKASDNSIVELCERNSKLGFNTEPLRNLSLPDIINISDTDSSRSSFEKQDSLFAKLRDELFTPAELASEKLLKDELSWRREKGSLPIDNSIDSKLSIDTSLKSNVNEDISIGEFFKRKTERLDALDLKRSPEKKYDPVPLINVSSATARETNDRVTLSEAINLSLKNSKSDLPNSKDMSRFSNMGVMETAEIAEILSKMNLEETPSRVMDYLMKNWRTSHDNTTNNPQLPRSIGSSSSDSSTIKNTQHSSNLTDSSKTFVVDSSPETSMKENSPRCTHNSPCRCPVTQTDSKGKNMKSILKDTSNSLETYIVQNQINAKAEKTEADWTDMKQENERIPSSNNTLSSIVTDSPSYSCSELEFSEDEPSEPVTNIINVQSEKWIEIRQDQPAVHKLYINVPFEVQIPVRSVTDRWLLVKIFLRVIKNTSTSKIIETNLPTSDVLLKLLGSETICSFKVTPLLLGRIEMVLVVQATDMVSKVKNAVEHIVVLESEKPEIQISNELLDFGLVPETVTKKMPVVITNLSKCDLLLNFIIVQDIEIVYIFGSSSETVDKTNSEIIVKKCYDVPKGRSVTLYIEMHTPTLAELSCPNEIFEINGKVSICVGDSNQQSIREITLTGSVGLTKLQFRASCQPLILSPGETKPLQMKNSGVVKISLAVGVFDINKDTADPSFTVDQSFITLRPNQSACVNITHSNTKDVLSGVLKRYIRLRHTAYAGCHFLFEIEVHPQNVKKNVMLVVPPSDSRSSSPRGHGGSPDSGARSNIATSQQLIRSCSQTSDASTNTKYLQDGKLPIETTRADLVWGCVKVGKSASQDFTLRNRCAQKIRLQACVTGRDFKIVKDQSENVDSLLLILRGMESRTITVIFTPTSIGACTGRLLFQPIEATESSTQVKRQRLALYGYGGDSLLSIQNVAKDSSGKMWLSFGTLDCNSSLEQSFILRNIGSLTAFALLSVRCKALYPYMDSNVKITPSDVLVAPRQEVMITVSFTPRREDFRNLHSWKSNVDVSEIASVEIMSGPEASRGRIRRLFRKLTQQGGIPSITSDLLITRLSAPFPGERMPDDLVLCKESTSGYNEILRDLVTRELTMTIECGDMDRHGFVSVLGADDTCLFQSVCDETTNATFPGFTSLPDAQQQRRISGGFCSVEPTKLLLTPPVKTEDNVILSSRHSRPMPFEIFCSKDDIQVNPRAGVVSPGETIVIKVAYDKEPLDSMQYYKIQIYVENEVMDVEIKIVNIKSRRYYS